MDWIWSVAIAAILFLPTALAVFCANAAKEKGRKTMGWFFLGFFLGFVGLLIVYHVNPKKRNVDNASTEK